METNKMIEIKSEITDDGTWQHNTFKLGLCEVDIYFQIEEIEYEGTVYLDVRNIRTNKCIDLWVDAECRDSQAVELGIGEGDIEYPVVATVPQLITAIERSHAFYLFGKELNKIK